MKRERPKKYIASCSFGKDSIATILLALEHDEPLDRVVFAEVFDYFADKGVLISICRYYDMADEMYEDGFEWEVDVKGYFGYGDTWVECANQAIRACLDLKYE